MFLASRSVAGAAGAVGAWVLFIKVRINSWKGLFSEVTGARVGAGTGPGAETPMAGFLWQTGDIVERRGRSGELKAEMEKKKEDLPCLLNRLVEPLGKSF